jgi:hypothetical protein
VGGWGGGGGHNAYQQSAISTVKSPAVSEQVRLGISQAGDQLASEI